MKIALVGNPNSGKTTLFNELTKLNQKVGNWTGVTIDKKSGKYFKDKNIEIIDLPGVYSLSPFSEDERITADYLKNEKIDVVINIVDSTNLERNLALTLQLIELKLPVVLALNMSDELDKNEITIKLDNIKKELGLDAVLISAIKNKNLDKLIDTVKNYTLHEQSISYSVLGETEEEKSTNRHLYISNIIDSLRTKGISKSQKRTDKVDRILTNKWLAFPIFAFVIWLMYFVSIQTIGALSIEGMEWIFGDLIGGNIQAGLENISAAPWLISLVIDGIIGGVGAVLGFVPQILILFLFISLLEASGYMSRVAFIMDRIFRKMGLSGKSFIPMIIGCGCSVPAIMSAKTIENERDRKTTIMLTPFIPCSAKLPVFALLAGALFPNNSFVAPSMYFIGIFMVIICGVIINKIRNRKAQADTFVMEMPLYRLPKAKNVLIELWEKAKGFIIKAGTIIFVASILVWFLQSFSFTFQMVESDESMLASIGRAISWIFVPLGFGNWQAAMAVVTGFLAKETVVSTFGVLLGGGVDADIGAALATLFTPQAAYAFMVFVLLSAPCFAAIGATKREMGSIKWTFMAMGFQTGVAYIAALIINQLGNLYVANKAIFITVIIVAAVAIALYFAIKSIIKSRKCTSNCACCNSKGCKNKPR